MKPQDPMKDSLYKTLRGVQMKSCPPCSRRERRPVYKRIEEFGYREVDGHTHVQTWCSECRKVATRISRQRKGA